MAITYTWSIETCEHELTSGSKCITTIHWGCTGVDGDYSCKSYGTTSHTPDPTDADFIPYDDVTEANAISFVHEVLNKSEIEANIAVDINNQKNPKSAYGKPWLA